MFPSCAPVLFFRPTTSKRLLRRLGRRRTKREIFEQGSGSCQAVAKEFIEFETHNRVVIIHCLCHSQKQGKIKFEPAIKLHRDIFFFFALVCRKDGKCAFNAVLSLALACLAFLRCDALLCPSSLRYWVKQHLTERLTQLAVKTIETVT